MISAVYDGHKATNKTKSFKYSISERCYELYYKHSKPTFDRYQHPVV